VTALLTEPEAAEALRMSVMTLQRVRRRGGIAYVRITERMVRYRRQDLDEYLNGGTTDAVPEPGSPARELSPITDLPKRPCVYFIRSGMAGPIKIGHAKALRARIHALSTAHHDQLFLLATLAGGAVQERRLHEKFSHLRIRGEWFTPAEDLLRFIETIREPVA
jgi:excisionase family DNA binding protein